MGAGCPIKELRKEDPGVNRTDGFGQDGVVRNRPVGEDVFNRALQFVIYLFVRVI